MYSESIATQRMEKALQRGILKSLPVYHTRPEVESFTRHLNSIYDPDSQSWRRELTPEEAQFIRNERILCRYDYNYFKTRFCNPPEAPVWMGDMSFKPIGDVQVGDEVIGWSKGYSFREGMNRGSIRKGNWPQDCLCRSLVTGVQTRRSPIVKATMRSGRVIRCTPDHLWSEGIPYRRQNRKWTTVSPGAFLRFVVDPVEPLPEDLLWDAAWLGGIYDGEGSWMTITQSVLRNPEIYYRIVNTLDMLGIPYSESVEGNGCGRIQIIGGKQQYLRFINYIQPTRRSRIDDHILSSKFGVRDEVLKVEPDGEGEVVALETETGNYIVWGYASKNCLIKDRSDRIVRYIPWVSQVILTDIFAQNEREGIAIEIQSLKARQLGVSREVSLAQLHRLLFYAHINAMMASSTPVKTGALADMMELTLIHLPHWLVPGFSGGPRDTAKRAGGEWFSLDTGSAVTLQFGSQISGIARGTTPTVIHASELSEFEYQGLGPEELIDSSLFRAVHPDARVFMVLESTALGMNNWWHKKWLTSKAGWPERRSRLRPVFLPWYIGSPTLGYVYPEKGFLDRSPVPPRYNPAPWALEHARRAEDFVHSNDLLRQYMGSTWTMPIEQIWFYEVERDQAVKENRLNQFLSELPGSDDEAFQSTNISIFSTETITAHRDRVKAPLAVYGLMGPDMSPRTILYSRSQIDKDKPIVNVHYEWGMNPRHYQLIPLLWNGYHLDDGLDKIYIWEWPEDGQIYGVGGDTSDGIGKDRSTLEVLRKGTAWQPAAQCAEFASDKLNALDLTPYAMALSALYSVKDLSTNFRRQCRTAIECKGKGDLTQLGMRLEGWTNFHPWNRVDQKTLDPSKFNKIGIFTNEWFRHAIQEYLMKMLRDMEIEVSSPYLVQEMQSLETDSVSQSFKVAYGGWDDRVMSLGFVIISLYQYEPNRPLATFQPTQKMVEEMKRKGRNVPAAYAQWKPNDQEKAGSLDEVNR